MGQSNSTEKKVDPPAPPAPTYEKAPKRDDPLFVESYGYASLVDLVYDFVNALTDDKLNLEVPDGFPVKDPKRLLTHSMNLIDKEHKDGLSFSEINNLMVHNREALIEKFGEGYASRNHIEEMREFFKHFEGAADKVFLTHLRFQQRKHGCVYGVLKDTLSKRITVFFRGSVFFTRDWRTNFNIRMAELRTPKKVKDKMEGILQKRVLVHKGFYDYLFNNPLMEDEQRYVKIIEDIEQAIGSVKGYSLTVTGHSLGGALATMFACKISGAGPKRDNIPRPVTCITYAAPINGSAGYRTVIENLERDGLLRLLRISNGEDAVPAGPPFLISIFRLFRLQKQVGINLRLSSGGKYILEHSSRCNIWTALRNTIFKPVCLFTTWHGIPLHKKRMKKIMPELMKYKLDDLYKDPKIVSEDFLNGNPL